MTAESSFQISNEKIRTPPHPKHLDSLEQGGTVSGKLCALAMKHSCLSKDRQGRWHNLTTTYMRKDQGTGRVGDRHSIWDTCRQSYDWR